MTENIVNQAVTAITTTSQLLSLGKARDELIITNTSTTGQLLTLSFGKPAVSLAGIVLAPYGVYYINRAEGFKPTSSDIYVISNAAAGALAIFERPTMRLSTIWA